ncbi:hypothetical protein Trydic_g7619 [Trypoxylus dichotomus]
MLYDDIGKTFLTFNLDNKLGFIPCPNNVAVFNLLEGHYVLVNPKTLFAVDGWFENYNPSQHYPVFLRAVQQLCIQHPTITIDTPGSFDFQHILRCFYKNQYDWSTIFPNQTDVATNISASFGDWFTTAKDWQEKGHLKVGFWGFLEAIFDNKAKMTCGIIRVLKSSFKGFGEFKAEFAPELYTKCKLGVDPVLEFSSGLEDYVNLNDKYSFAGAWEWIASTVGKSKVITIRLFHKSYEVHLRAINKQVVLRFTIESPTGIDMDNRIVFLPDTLLLFNENSNIATYLCKNYFVLINLKTTLIFVGKYNFLMKIEGLFLQNARLVELTYKEQYLEALEIIKDLTEIRPEGAFPLSKLIIAVKNGQITEIEKIVGEQAATDVIDFFGQYFKDCTGSLESIILQVFGNPKQYLTKAWAKAFAVIAALGQEWTKFLQTMKLQLNIFNIPIDILG